MIAKRTIFLIVGLISLSLGTIGIAIPVLPTVPFYLLAAFCFSQSSQKLHDWFLSTELYKMHLDSYVKGEGMTKPTKIRIIITVTLLMGFGIFMMARKNIIIPCVILVIVWIAHIYYFILELRQKVHKHALFT